MAMQQIFASKRKRILAKNWKYLEQDLTPLGDKLQEITAILNEEKQP